MILRSFSVILHSPTTLCPSVCPQCVLCLSALGFINKKKIVFSLCLCPFSRSLSCHHGIQVGRAPRSECQIRYFEQFGFAFFGICYSLYLWLVGVSVLPKTSLNLYQCLVSSQPPGGIPGSQPLLPNSLDPTRPQGKTWAPLVVEILRWNSSWWNM